MFSTNTELITIIQRFFHHIPSLKSVVHDVLDSSYLNLSHLSLENIFSTSTGHDCFINEKLLIASIGMNGLLAAKT